MQAPARYIQQAEREGLFYSLAMHLFLLVVFIFGLPSFMSPPTIDEPAAITVEILPIAAMSNVRPSNSKPAKPEPKEPPKPKEETKIETNDLEELKEEKEKPSPLVKTEDTPPAPKEVEQHPDAEPEKKPEEKPKEKEKEKEEDPLDAILKGVKDTAAKDKKSAAKPEEKPSTTSKSGNRSNQFDPNSPEAVSIRDAIQGQIYRCWNVPAGARNAENLIIPLEIDYDKTGKPVKVNLAKSAASQYRSDSFFRAAADSAIRAVNRCAPLQNMPGDQFKIWQYVDMNFNPKEMLF